MKKLFIIISIVLGFAMTANAQSFSYQRYDSLVNADTISFVINPAGLKTGDYYYSTSLQADSISGSTAGTCWFQVSNWTTGDYWHSVDTVTINGVQTLDFSTGVLQAARARFYMISTGSQKTYVRFAIHAVKRQ